MIDNFCTEVTNCIDLITIKYPKFKKEIIKATKTEDLSDECKDFIKNHQDQTKNKEEIDKYINKF